MVNDEIQKELFSMQDEKYRDFQVKLIPGKTTEDMIGVRTPDLRKYASKLAKRDDISEFLEALPHKYFDEHQLHAFIISEEKKPDRCIELIDEFLPYVDNWATCDQLTPKVFKKNHKELLDHIKRWMAAEHPYSVRFGIKMLMSHFLEDDYDRAYPQMVAAVESDEYYVKMMVAWYFATALAKQYDDILPFIEDGTLETWTHNKSIQKACESYRILPEQKEYLRSLKKK